MKKLLAVSCALMLLTSTAQAAKWTDFVDIKIAPSQKVIDKQKENEAKLKEAATADQKYRSEKISQLKKERDAKIKEVDTQINAKKAEVKALNNQKGFVMSKAYKIDKLNAEIESLNKKKEFINNAYEKQITPLEKKTK